MTKSVFAGALEIGGAAPVSIQSMTNTDTADVAATSEQIKALADAGCDLVRISVYNDACAEAVRQLVDQSPVPLCADIHFDYKLAIKAMENGIAKLRINPGNMGNKAHVHLLADCALRHGVPIRIGVNAGSLPKPILEKHGGVTTEGMVEAAGEHIQLLEKVGFDNIVLSLKASDVRLTVAACRLAHRVFAYPQHLGVTEAGLPDQGTVKSAIGIGALLLDGIGNTIRVSLTGSPLPEVAAALSILRALNLRGGVQLISCPTCGRTQVDVERIAGNVEKQTRHITAPVKVAVMGCVVNGPGEAREADIAYCGGKGSGALYVGGAFVRKVDGDPTEAILHAIEAFLADQPVT